MAVDFSTPVFEMLVTAAQKRLGSHKNLMKNPKCVFLAREAERAKKTTPITSFMTATPSASKDPPPQEEVTEATVVPKRPPTQIHVSKLRREPEPEPVVPPDSVEDIDSSNDGLDAAVLLGNKEPEPVSQKKAAPVKIVEEEEVNEIYDDSSSDEDVSMLERLDELIQEEEHAADVAMLELLDEVRQEVMDDTDDVQCVSTTEVHAEPEIESTDTGDVEMGTVDEDQADVEPEESEEVQGPIVTGPRKRSAPKPCQFLKTMAEECVNSDTKQAKAALEHILTLNAGHGSESDEYTSDADDNDDNQTSTVSIEKKRKLTPQEIVKRERERRFEVWLSVKSLAIGNPEDYETLVNLAMEKMPTINILDCNPHADQDMEEHESDALDYAYVEAVLKNTREALLSRFEDTRLGDVLQKLTKHSRIEMKTVYKTHVDRCYISDEPLQSNAKTSLTIGGFTFVVSRLWKTWITFLQVVMQTDPFLLTAFQNFINRMNAFDLEKPTHFAPMLFSFAQGAYCDMISNTVLSCVQAVHMLCKLVTITDRACVLNNETSQ